MRKRTMIGAAMALACAAAPGKASAEWLSGRDLLEKCESKKDIAFGICLGYIDAVVDMNEVGEAPAPPGGIRLPVGLDNGRLREIVVAFLRANPAMLHYAGSDLVHAALSKAYPGE